MYLIQCDDYYKDMWEARELYDLAEYPKNSPFYDPSNNKVIGKMKDEAKGQPVVEFIGLRPKMYSYLTLDVATGTENISEKHTAKGISAATSARLRHEDYKRQLLEPARNTLINRRIGAELHELHTIEQIKSGLSSYDDKRYILADNIHTLAYGHKDLPPAKREVEVKRGRLIYSHDQAVLEGIGGVNLYNLLAGINLGREPRDILDDISTYQRRQQNQHNAAYSYGSVFPNATPAPATDTFDDFLGL